MCMHFESCDGETGDINNMVVVFFFFGLSNYIRI